MNFRTLFIFVVSSMLTFSLVSCDGIDFQESKTFIGDQTVSADTLNLGKQVYTEYCMACHGVQGDGNGSSAKGSVPPPRNFTQGLFKFGHVKEGGLPTNADFSRIIKGGLNGTAMLKWDVSDKQVYAVTQYIKTFAPKVWQNKEVEVGTPIKATKDPYGLARKGFAIQEGEKIYHVVAQCQSCHRAYVTKTELSNMNQQVNGESITDFDSDMYQMKNQESEYYFYDSKDRFAKFLPPDFTWHEIRSATTEEEIYKRLVSGVTGSGMPAWRDVLEDEQIWATAYYIRSLVDMKNAPARKELMKKLENQ
jgi:mono/diheme cytochrome c family protein